MVDIRLDDSGQLTRATDGDAPLVSGTQELLQRICAEAQTQPGEVFYAPDWGWGLRGYMQQEDSALMRLELSQRIRARLTQYEEIDPAQITITYTQRGETLLVLVGVALLTDGSHHTIQASLGRVTVEVTTIDTR